MLENDNLVEAKELEIASLRAQLAAVRTHGGTTATASQSEITYIVSSTPKSQQGNSGSCIPRSWSTTVYCRLVGKERPPPPVDLFTDQSDVLWKDWLPTFELAAAWNNWTEEEKLWQLAGHLRGKASQEWTLLPATDKLAFASATRALSKRLDRGTKALAAQEFCHTTQQSSE